MVTTTGEDNFSPWDWGAASSTHMGSHTYLHGNSDCCANQENNLLSGVFSQGEYHNSQRQYLLEHLKHLCAAHLDSARLVGCHLSAMKMYCPGWEAIGRTKAGWDQKV